MPERPSGVGASARGVEEGRDGATAPRIDAEEARNTAAEERRTVAVAFAVASIPLAIACARFAWTCDDAYISFRYARHLALGHGLVFNLGEEPPVEGYSNLLWTLWLALFARIGVPLELAANATSIASGAALLFLVTRIAVRRLALDRPRAIAAALVLATLPPVALWSTGGLETLTFALLVFRVFERLQLDPARPRGLEAGLAAAAAVLLRVDGAAWAGLALLLGACGPGFLLSPARRRAAALAALALGLAVLGVTLFRLGYHGEWIANTARVKAGPSLARLERGARYLAVFLLSVPSVPLIALGALATRGRPQAALAWRSGAVLAAAGAYSVLVGGDFMPMGRFLVVAMPFVALLGAAWIGRVERRSIALAGAALGIALGILAIADRGPVPRSVRERLHFRWNDPHFESEVEQWAAMRERAGAWSDVGRALAGFARPEESIVLSGIGAIGYHGGLFVHDRFGLVDREAARAATALERASPGHDRAVPVEFFFDRRPDYLGAWIAPRGSPRDAGLPPGWRESTIGRVSVIEAYALDASAGFAPGTELRVLRYRPER